MSRDNRHFESDSKSACVHLCVKIKPLRAIKNLEHLYLQSLLVYRPQNIVCKRSIPNLNTERFLNNRFSNFGKGM